MHGDSPVHVHGDSPVHVHMIVSGFQTLIAVLVNLSRQL